MSAMEFTWKMVSVLIWPLVVVALGIVFRRPLAVGFQKLAAGLRTFKAAGVELAFEMDNAWQDVTDVLARVPDQETAPGEVPTNLVDLYPVAAKNPRRAVREAFRHVRNALTKRYPTTAGVSLADLPDALDGLVAHGELTSEVEQAVRQVARVLAMIDRVGDQDEARRLAFECIGLAESAIHVILRGTEAHGTPAPEAPKIAGRWTGTYLSSKPPMDIELLIDKVDGDQISGEMHYPSGHVTRSTIKGHVVATDRPGFVDTAGYPRIEWQEHARNPAAVDVEGTYRAVIIGNRLIGDWRKGERLVGAIHLERKP
ncbi:hypothetical protein [Dactylosporangium sp. NPDC051541]|uniref:hypothetical protein n=1 Tax=Dactylosporangium sp. NPDC051541 TaxID=3363977 RepID=UPI003799CED4